MTISEFLEYVYSPVDKETTEKAKELEQTLTNLGYHCKVDTSTQAIRVKATRVSG